MAKNIEIKGSMPEFYQAATRPVEEITLDDLSGKSEAFAGFSVEVGDKFAFPTIDKQEYRRQRVQRKLRPNEEPTYVYSIKSVRTRNGVQSNEWFSLNFLTKTDVDRVAVNPSWNSLADAKARAEALCKMGEIEVLSEKKIDVPVFEGGRPVRVPTLDPATGEQVIDEQGTAVTHVQTRPQTGYVITAYAE